jgi:RIO-like serine/threonine protein kinase
MQREIRIRESIKVKKPDLEHDGVVPILSGCGRPGTQYIDGVLLPLYGKSLDKIAEEHGSISLLNVCSLLKTINDLQHIGITHGDICDRNVVVKVDESVTPTTESTLAVIDFGEIAPS